MKRSIPSILGSGQARSRVRSTAVVVGATLLVAAAGSLTLVHAQAATPQSYNLMLTDLPDGVKSVDISTYSGRSLGCQAISGSDTNTGESVYVGDRLIATWYKVSGCGKDPNAGSPIDRNPVGSSDVEVTSSELTNFWFRLKATA